ncbi:MAG: hypothetical protein H8D43_00455 [Chloroflexi bacterium]|nr:hypothetical protein [Chloroflexota bacterium]
MRDDKLRLLRVVDAKGRVARCPEHPRRDLCQVADPRAGDMNGETACQGCLTVMLNSTTKLDKSQIVILETGEVVSDFTVDFDEHGNQILLL